VYCWGNNIAGQLGDGTTTFRAVPVAVIEGHRFTQVSGGGLHTCGVSDQAAWRWGTNQFGTPGLGSSGGRSTVPQPVASPS
jgi:alpha-tubulin suppressor-like RCC1 family protein